MATEEKTDGLVCSSSKISTQKQFERQRFYVELNPDETTIVSWKKLVRDGKTFDQCSAATTTATAVEAPPKKTTDDNPEVGKCSDPFVRNEALGHQNTSSGHQQLRKRTVEMTEAEGIKNDDPSSKHVKLENTSSTKESAKASTLLDHQFNSPPLSEARASLMITENKSSILSSKSNTTGTASMFPLKVKQSDVQKTEKLSSGKSRMRKETLGDPSDAIHRNAASKCVPSQTDPRCGKLTDENKIKKSASVDGAKPATKPFSTIVERAIKELEETVAKSKSFKVETSDAHTSWLTIDRELPLEVRAKLGEVARLVRSNEGGKSEELVNCLVGIIGKLVHGKTSKKHLRKYVTLKLSAKKEKAEKFKAIKNEILELISTQQMGRADIPEAKDVAALAETYKLDIAMEDKLFDLYELCVQGNSGDIGVEAQKLFIELGDLWPKGVMNHHKLRDAVSRAKSRRVLVDKTDQGRKTLKSDIWISQTVTDNSETSNLVPSMKKSTTADHPVTVSLKTSHPPPKAVKQHNFSTGKKLKRSASAATQSSVPQQTPLKKHIKIKFSLKRDDGTHRYKCDTQASIDKLKCLRIDAPLT